MKLQSELEAVVVSDPTVHSVFNPVTLEEDECLGYEAEVQYKRKPNEVRMIICNSLDVANVGDPVMISYHLGMRRYQHSRAVIVSNPNNCFGDFYYTNGKEA